MRGREQPVTGSPAAGPQGPGGTRAYVATAQGWAFNGPQPSGKHVPILGRVWRTLAGKGVGKGWRSQGSVSISKAGWSYTWPGCLLSLDLRLGPATHV